MTTDTKITVEVSLIKETKNYVLYGPYFEINKIYIPKPLMPGTPPARLRITMEPCND